MSMSEPSAFDQITGAVIDGSKAGAAYAVARDLTKLVLRHTKLDESLPAFLRTSLGDKLLPVLVCYAVAFLTVLIPGIPKAEMIRKIATYAAKGAATVAVADLMPSIQDFVPAVLGLAAQHDLDVK